MPKRALSAAFVARIKPPASGQTEYFDKGYPGLALSVSYGGARTFVVFYRVGGRLKRTTLGTFPAMSLADAREAWRAARQDVAKGKDPALTLKRETGISNFSVVAEEWLKRDRGKEAPRKERSAQEMKRIVDRELISAWGHRGIDEIQTDDVLRVLDAISDRGAVTMARRVQAHVTRLFKWAKQRRLIVDNPTLDLPKQGSETKRDRVLTNDELIKVWRAAEKLGWPFGIAIQLLIMTGARREEIGQLRWSEIDGDMIKLSGTRTKNGRPFDLPLSPMASLLLEQCPRIAGSSFVFSTTGRSSISGWSRVKVRLDKSIGLSTSWRVHDLRRTVATGMNELGIEPHIVEAVLNHLSGSRGGVAGIYNRAKYAEAKRAALSRWAVHVHGLVTGATSNVVGMRKAQ
jgi:integrase